MSDTTAQLSSVGADGPSRTPGAEPMSAPTSRNRLTAVRDTVGAAVGVVLGLVPHVMHHIGLLAGAALVTGVGGNLLFFAIGLLFSIPLLRRLHRRFASWWAPGLAVAVFTALFALSALVIGPAISGASGADSKPPSQAPNSTHDSHHGM